MLGTLTKYRPDESTKRNGFSRTTGVVAIVVTGVAGQVPPGGRTAPTKTMFQLPPTQFIQSVFLDKNCCCDPELTWPSIFELAMNPPLEYPPSHRFMEPRTWTRRRNVPCDTAQTAILASCRGMTARFSAPRQKFKV